MDTFDPRREKNWGRDLKNPGQKRHRRYAYGEAYFPKPPVGLNDSNTGKSNAGRSHKDYNIVAMSDFKVNPSLYMLWSKSIPLAVTRYGRIQSMVLSLGYYNELLDKIRSLQNRQARLLRAVEIIDPNLVKLISTMREKTEVNPSRPVWPMLDQQPKRRKTDELTRAALDEALMEMRAWNEVMANPNAAAPETPEFDW